MTAFLIIAFFVLLISLGVPIAFVIGLISLAGISTISFIPNLTVFMKMFNGLNSFVLLAIPLFILAANIMNHGKITEMLVKFCISLTGNVRGGLSHSLEKGGQLALGHGFDVGHKLAPWRYPLRRIRQI